MKRNLLTLALILLYTIDSYAQAPTITSFSPTSGPVGTLVTITGTNLSSPTAFSIGGVAAIKVSGTATSLVGMVMPGAATGIVSVTTAAGLTTNGNFTVTATKYPSTQQGDKWVGTGAIDTPQAAQQGTSVCISANGNTAIVGGQYDSSQSGAAWIYIRSGAIWTQQGSKLIGTGAVGAARQGCSVAISADGNTAILGGPTDNLNQGAAWVFTRSGAIWTQQGSKLVGMGTVGNPLQGISVSLSADGNTAIVGGSGDSIESGAIWVFVRTGAVWAQQGAKLVGTGAVGFARLGSAVALSADGNTVIAGAEKDNGYQGAAWVFIRSGTIWSQQGTKLLGTGGVGNAAQGWSVAISANGNTALVGGPSDNRIEGAAWVYTRSGTSWSQQGSKLLGTGAVSGGGQGSSVALSADGNTAVVGGSNDSFGMGATWIYTRSGSTWIHQGLKLRGTGAIYDNAYYVYQGFSVSLSADGNTVLEGAPGDSLGRGAVWAFNSSIPAGIEDRASQQDLISIYPNPATETFTLSVNAEMIGTSYTFTDMTGRIIHSHIVEKENTVISLDGLSSGLYILQIEGRSYKVVKE